MHICWVFARKFELVMLFICAVLKIKLSAVPILLSRTLDSTDTLPSEGTFEIKNNKWKLQRDEMKINKD